MKLKRIGSNQTEVEREDGVIVFYSYETPVAVFVPGRGALCTKQRFSVTTTKHIGQTVKRWGATRNEVEHDEILSYAK